MYHSNEKLNRSPAKLKKKRCAYFKDPFGVSWKVSRAQFQTSCCRVVAGILLNYVSNNRVNAPEIAFIYL